MENKRIDSKPSTHDRSAE